MKRALVFLAASFASLPAVAGDIVVGNLTSQMEFRQLAEDLGSATSFKPVTPSESLGILGFDIGVAGTMTELQHKGTFAKAGGGSQEDLVTPTARVQIGLPWDFDIGALYGGVSGTNITFWGGNLKWSLVSGSTWIPAVAVRGSYTQMMGVDNLDFNTKGLDISISKGIAMFTPYGGVGQVWVTGTPSGNAALSKESFTQSKVFVGLNVNILVMNLAVEADRTGNANSASLKLGIRF